MATSLFFMPTDQTSVKNPNELLRNTHLVSGEIRTEPQKSRGRKPGSKTGQKKQKKQRQRGKGIAELEREIRAGEEKNKSVAAVGDTIPNKTVTRLPVPVDPVLVLLGFSNSLGGCRSIRTYCGGVGSGEIMIDPICSPWDFVEASTHELSSIPNLRMYNASNNRWDDTCIKKKRLEEDENVGRSNGGELLNPPQMNDYLRQPDQRNQGFGLDHRIARSSAEPPSPSQYVNEATNHTGSVEEFGSYMEGNPRNGSGGVKEYEFFPGKNGRRVSVATSVVGECSPNASSTIDLSLKL